MPLGSNLIGAGGISGTVVKNPPAVVITSPTGQINDVQTTIEWTYSSPVPRAQVGFRVEVRSQDGAITLFQTGFIAGAGTSYLIPFLMSPGSTYRLRLQAFDGYSWSPPATTTVTTFAFSAGDFGVDPRVGSIYEIGLNGEGYMLADRPERRYQRRSATLETPRFAVGDTPFSESIERYTIAGFSNWQGGAGQRFSDRSTADDTKFWQSEGVNPFEEAELRLLPATSLQIPTTFATPNTMVAGDRLYVQTGNKTFSHTNTFDATPSTFTVDDAVIIKTVTSDGLFWYAADGANIYRNNAAANPASEWSTVGCDLIEWCSDRLAGTYISTGRAVFTTFADDGTEEVAGGRFSFADATITQITAGDGWIWFAVERGGVSEVRAWQLGGGTDSVSIVATTLPEGEQVTGLGFYLGNVFIRTQCGCVDGGTNAILYRGVPSDGRISLSRVTGMVGAGLDQGPGVFGGNDRFAFFSWRKMLLDDTSGVGAIDLSTGGWAKWMYADDDAADGPVTAITNWQGRLVFTIQGYGTVAQGSVPVSSGFLSTSHTYFGSSLSKVLDDIRINTNPMPAGGSIELEYSLNAGVSYVPLNNRLGTAGESEMFEGVGVRTPSVGIKIKFEAATTSPVVTLVQARVHPLVIADQVLVLPVNCADTLTGLNTRVLPESGPGAGMRRVRRLEALMGTQVLLQDVDWPATKETSVWEMVQIDVQSDGVRESRQNRRTDSAVAVVTLRRAL